MGITIAGIAARPETVCHIERYFVGGFFAVTDAQGSTETELLRTWVSVVWLSSASGFFGCFEHLGIGQTVGCGALVTVHSVGLVAGDFLELVAVLRKLVRQWRAKYLFFFSSCF